MTQERFEWLEIPDGVESATPNKIKTPEAVLGKRCPQCNWLDEETSTACFRCGYRFNVDQQLTARIESLGINLPPRVIETPQNLENFFRIHGRQKPPSPVAEYTLRLQAEQLRLGQGFDHLICLEDIAVEHYEHQLETALRALQEMRGRALLADEVGLGKTIEAGIVMKELIERGLVRTILVLTPASLTEQWREELSAKFREEFTVIDNLAQLEKMAKAESGRWLMSLDRAKMKRYSEQILQRDYDLLIVDEAHKLKNRGTLAWKFVNQIRKRYVLMLTATPVQNDLMELYSLITILSPGQLGTVRGFRRHFLEQSDPRLPKNATALRRLLGDVMIRNRRSSVDVTFPQRRAAIYHLSLSDQEWKLYTDVTDYIRRRFRDPESDKHLRLTLITLQKELCSSPQAVAHTLAKMADDRSYSDPVRAELNSFLALAQSIDTGRKLSAVKEILQKFPGKFLIFTEYRQTLETIVTRLAEWGISAEAFHGGLNIRQKEAAIDRFRREESNEESDKEDGDKSGDASGDASAGVRVLVSTESGAEGRNLQFCHQLINYDLPWNPMRVEQRIGRLHRLGQAKDVTIFNLSCHETIEAYIVDLLARKIRMFELVIGELDLILGGLDGADSFEDMLRQAWEAAESEDDLQGRLEAVGDLLVRARQKYEQVRESNAILDGLMER